jgi:putative colanic acid biosynthesis UDP-glucose lipid carrier transferase
MLSVLRHRIYAEWLLVIAVLLVLGVAFKLIDLFSRQVILTWFAAAPICVVLAQGGLRRFTAFRALRGRGVQSHIIVGANETGLRLAQRLMANPHLGTFRGFFDNRASERLPEGIGEEQLLGTMTDIRDYVRLNPVNNIYICLPIRTEQRVLHLMEQLKDTTASVYFVPDIFGFDLIQPQVSDVDGIPVLAVRETPFCGMNGVLKRGSDIVIASCLLLLLWPVLLAIALGVRLTSPGPIVFRQRRYGLYGDAFEVYKFRTMTVCEDRMLTQASPDDPRVTPFGRFLRRTSLDELPQLLNVLFGSMSLVGPRPHAVNQNEEYRKIIDGYMLRHKVRPGITGWAQVNGLRGETRTVEKMRQRVEYDLDYLRNWSLSLDLHILLRTALVVLRDRNAY